MPHPMSTPTAAGIRARRVAITDPTVAPMPRWTSGIAATWPTTIGSRETAASCRIDASSTSSVKILTGTPPRSSTWRTGMVGRLGATVQHSRSAAGSRAAAPEPALTPATRRSPTRARPCETPSRTSMRTTRSRSPARRHAPAVLASVASRAAVSASAHSISSAVPRGVRARAPRSAPRRKPSTVSATADRETCGARPHAALDGGQRLVPVRRRPPRLGVGVEQQALLRRERRAGLQPEAGKDGQRGLRGGCARLVGVGEAQAVGAQRIQAEVLQAVVAARKLQVVRTPQVRVVLPRAARRCTPSIRPTYSNSR